MIDAVTRALEDAGLHRCPHQAEGAIVFCGCQPDWCDEQLTRPCRYNRSGLCRRPPRFCDPRCSGKRDARVTANTLRLCDEIDAHGGATKAEHDELARERSKPCPR